MKRIFSFLTLCILSINILFAQEVVIKAGTIVPLESVNNVRASKVHLGQIVDFRVMRDIKVDRKVVIPSGAIAKGAVYEAKRSSWCGTKGRLGVKVRSVVLPNGDELFFTASDIYITGKNRTAVAVVPAVLGIIPTLFICGSKAEMKAGYEVDATIASTTKIILD